MLSISSLAVKSLLGKVIRIFAFRSLTNAADDIILAKLFFCNKVAYVDYSPTFAALNKRTPIPVSKLTAVFLLVVFLFIHVGKAFHAHHHATKAYATKVAHEVKQLTDCALCDFHFSKDCDDTPRNWQGHMPTYFPVKHLPYQRSFSASIGLLYADRGPPAVA